MNFISSIYFFFMIGCFFLYWHAPIKYRNIILLILSCFFYAYYSWRFLGLIAVSILTSYYCGNRILPHDHSRKRKKWLAFSIVINIGLLGYFKYIDFFIVNINNFLYSIGFEKTLELLNIILPIGISFYIFQSLTYPLDIYFRKMSPNKSFIDFATYVTFFPKLISGPIERASIFLNQLMIPNRFIGEDLQEGCARILTGIFKKAVIADNLSEQLVSPVFSNPGNYNTASVWIAMFSYAIQIYADFSGYSNIAIGSARLFGFKIPENFSFPYLALDFSDFWRRWHITMSTFFRDYIYIPLGGNRCSNIRVAFNLFVTMLLCGLWHGAAWTFILWGVLHGLMLILNHFIKEIEFLKKLDLLVIPVGWFFTQIGVCLAWVFFRSDNFSIAIIFIKSLFLTSGYNYLNISWTCYACIVFFIIDHLYGLLNQYNENIIQKISTTYKAMVYVMMVIIAYNIIPDQKSQFIYFNF